MSFLVQHIRSSEYAKRPKPLDLAPGQLAVNYNVNSTGVYLRTDTGQLTKVGPAHVGTAAPEQKNWTERSIGEMWLDTSAPYKPILNMYTEAGWVAVNAPPNSITSDKIQDGAVTAQKITLDESLLPSSHSSISLGADLMRFDSIFASNVYAGDLHLKNDHGDWTIIEAEEYLTLRNNKTGKKFKLVMEAID